MSSYRLMLYGDSKLAGVLIEHSLSVDSIARTIVGIGLNINQVEFPSDLPNPTSMTLLQSKRFDRREVLDRFMQTLEAWYERLRQGNKQQIEECYRSKMYHLDEPHTYALP